MNSSDTPKFDLARAEMLLQRFFEKDLSALEAEELKTYCVQSPEFLESARKNFEVDHTLCFFGDLQRQALSLDSETLRSAFGIQHGGLTLSSVASPLNSSDSPAYLDLDLEKLVHWTDESPSLIQESERPKPFSERRLKGRDPNDSKNSPWLPWLVLPCLILFVVGVYREFFPVEKPKPVETPSFLAKITAVADPVFSEDAPIYKSGQWVDTETIRLESGWLEIRLESGVRLVLEGPTLFNVQNAVSTFCQSGRVSVEVPKGAEGFEVQTPLMNVRDLGTEFVVDVDDEKSEVHVVNGKVEIDRLSETPRLIKEGIAMIARSGRETVQAPADRNRYVSAPRVAVESLRYELLCRERWDEKQSQWSGDPDLLFHLNFTNSNFTGTAKTAPGRWPDKNAVVFSKTSDTVRLSVAKKSRSFTLAASVRLSDLSHASNPIFSIGDMEKGALHWQINHEGKIQLMFGSRDKLTLENLASPPAVSRRQCGVWLQLTTTVDAERETVTHYLDGRSIASFPWKNEVEFDFSEAELGNWKRSARAPTDRFFNGRIDEFLLLNRVLSPEEIRSLTF